MSKTKDIKRVFPEHILKAIRQRFGLEEDDKTHDEEFNSYDLTEAMNSYLSWHGIFGYTSDIVRIAKLFGAKDF